MWVVAHEKGEYGSATIVSSGARDTDISGTCGMKSMAKNGKKCEDVTNE
jgi:hypothetical protein